ncbi:MAG: YbcC family protein [Pseudomonadota bacterium]
MLPSHFTGLESHQPSAEAIRLATRDACGRIAPVWPLDSFVAVNPYLGFADQPFAEAARYLSDVAGERLFMPRAWFAARLESGRIRPDDLTAAAHACGHDWSQTFLLEQVRSEGEIERSLPLFAEMLDAPDAPPLSEFVIEQISRYLAAHFDRGQALWPMPRPTRSLFAGWLEYTRIDRSAAAAGLRAARGHLAAVPDDPAEAIDWALARLAPPVEILSDYLFVALKSVGGWASWCRYRVWQAEMQGGSCRDLEELLAIRLVWEAIVLACQPDDTMHRRWQDLMTQWRRQTSSERRRRTAIDEVLLSAAEIAFRRPLIARMAEARPDEPVDTARPAFQLAFCIDVRSEVFRRHLESCDREIQTIGFAGFFGVPLEYQRLGETGTRSHTPVLLNPAYRACEVADDGSEALARQRLQRQGFGSTWKHFKLSAASCFTFVESAGLSYVPRLIADTLGWHVPAPAPDRAGLDEDERRRLHPRLGCSDATAIPEADRVSLAEGMLKGLGMTETFAPVVVLAGHGSSTVNNPHRAGLDCGACAGQTGEASARVAAALLNDPAVRAGLTEQGITVPGDTRFVAALHDTTTDDFRLLDTENLPDTHRRQLTRLRERVARAGELTRLERVVTLTGEAGNARRARAQLDARSRDWSQVRPEWGLAGNAAFIAAPRSRTRHMNLGGRAFLHDYDWRRDPDFAVLNLIMTAPLVVANWINLQYYGSTVDNERQGSGNKVLHNVVGGLVGVLEGNGGDLRVGLSLQSLHDGRDWRHEPLRLSAFIEAPPEAIDEIIAANKGLRRLVENRWLTILQIAPGGEVYLRRGPDDWQRQEAPPGEVEQSATAPRRAG